MKLIKLILSLAFIIALLFFAKNYIINDVNILKGNGNVITKMHDVEIFNNLVFKGHFDIFLIKGEKENILISADKNLHQHINIEQKNDTLHIYSDRDLILRPTKLYVEVTYTELKRIILAGASNLSADTTIKADSFNIDISGAASGKLDFDNNKLYTNVSGAANLTLTGKTISHKAFLDGASNLKAYNLSTKNTTINLIGAGSAKINATEELIASLSGVGSIKYTGNPESKKINVDGLGRIKSVE